MSVYDLPAVNATLNGISAILLAIGYVLIRQRRIQQHRRVMLAAFTVSCLFLICYVVYHYNVGSKRFPGQGPIRTVYFFILITHIVLAALVPPMAIALLENPWKSIAVLILYIVIQQVESHLLTPYVMAQQVSLLPAITLLSQVFFATFFGFLGLLLALPLTVVAQVWLKEVVIIDVLDRWQSHPEIKTELIVVPDTPPKSTELIEDIDNNTKVEAEIDNQQSTDDLDAKV